QLKARLQALNWPNRAHSRIVEAGGIAFHIQELGNPEKPTLLLIHGTGASTHSFAPLMELLGTDFHCMAIDLPGHGFTPLPNGLVPTLPEMARVVLQLLSALHIKQVTGVGHSAGAAILIEMALRAPEGLFKIFAVNAALEPMPGHAFLSPLAKVLFLNPLTPQLFAWRAQFAGMTKIMLKATGSNISQEAMRQYQVLLEDKHHVSGALAMMAAWELEPLQKKLENLKVPLTLIAASDDNFVPAKVSLVAATKTGNATSVLLASGGHLVHEVDAATIAQIINKAS
ncbi:MAG: alpha/beta fold hydrolase BchO, partial [Notoacmeibacter sp.]